jgi:acetylglutamate synthase
LIFKKFQEQAMSFNRSQSSDSSYDDVNADFKLFPFLPMDLQIMILAKEINAFEQLKLSNDHNAQYADKHYEFEQQKEVIKLHQKEVQDEINKISDPRMNFLLNMLSVKKAIRDDILNLSEIISAIIAESHPSRMTNHNL